MIDHTNTSGIAPSENLPEREAPDLKKAREAKGLSIEDIHKSTRIAIHILQAIEELKFEKLPEPVYTRTFIKTYAKTVGLEPDPILKAYEQFLIQRKGKITIGNESKKGEISHILTGKLKYLQIAGLILITAVLFVYLTNQPKNDSERRKIPSQEVHKHVPESTVKQEPPPVERDAPYKTTSYPVKQHKLTIEGKELTWIRVKEDDKTPVEMFVKSGDRVERYAREAFHLDIGNAAGINVYINDKPLGNLGGKGQVVHIKVP